MPAPTGVLKIGGFDHVEPVYLGGGKPVLIQTMWKDRLNFEDLEGEAGEAALERIGRLKKMGCRLLRFAVPDMAAAGVLGRLAARVSMPLVADIHFDYKIALRCLDFPVAKIRINPGNIGGREKVKLVLDKAALKKIPVRVGVNAGSLPGDIRKQLEEGLGRPEALVMAAERELAVFNDLGFQNVLVSLKASSVGETIRANRLLAEKAPDLPLHVGLTEAGPLVAGVVKNTAALIPLLADGIGDTVRVSLSDTMENEVMAAREILDAAADMAEGEGKTGIARRLRRNGVSIVSCPRCGRHSFDTHGFTERWMPYLYSLERRITVAVMGCAVNGPGEARHADLGITGAGDKTFIFRRGEIIRTIPGGGEGISAGADRAFREELDRL